MFEQISLSLNKYRLCSNKFRVSSSNKFRVKFSVNNSFNRSGSAAGNRSAPRPIFFAGAPQQPKKTPTIRPEGANGWSCSKFGHGRISRRAGRTVAMPHNISILAKWDERGVHRG